MYGDALWCLGVVWCPGFGGGVVLGVWGGLSAILLWCFDGLVCCWSAWICCGLVFAFTL